MLVYPAWFSAIDREFIDAAMIEACPPVFFIFWARQNRTLSALLPDPVETVLTVAKVVASRLDVRGLQPLSDDRRQDLEDLLAQIMVCVTKNRTSPKRSLQEVEVMVREALSMSVWWPSLEPLPTPSASLPRTPDVPIDSRSLLTLQEAAKRLNVSVSTLKRKGAARRDRDCAHRTEVAPRAGGRGRPCLHAAGVAELPFSRSARSADPRRSNPDRFRSPQLLGLSA